MLKLASLCTAATANRSEKTEAEKLLISLDCFEVTMPVDEEVVFKIFSMNSKLTPVIVIAFGSNSHVGNEYISSSASVKSLKIFADEFHVHSNILKYAEIFYERHWVKAEEIIRSKHDDHPAILFCGHCFGGCIAQLITLKYLLEIASFPADKIKSYSFGSPLFADLKLDQFISTKFSSNFHNYVLDCDMIPRALLIPLTDVITMIKNNNNNKHENENKSPLAYIGEFLSHHNHKKCESSELINMYKDLLNMMPSKKRKEIIRNNSAFNIFNFVPCGTYTFIEHPVASINSLNNRENRDLRYLPYSDLNSKMSQLEKHSVCYSERCLMEHDMIDGYLKSLNSLIGVTIPTVDDPRTDTQRYKEDEVVDDVVEEEEEGEEAKDSNWNSDITIHGIIQYMKNSHSYAIILLSIIVLTLGKVITINLCVLSYSNTMILFSYCLSLY